ncbi:MAG TPA: DUF4097 family beta strand repeat-containing protein [Terriglobales bacterium]|nr:DUF4097 family beta strand repeat-containing protein [Terriglobales bacterium]
MSSPVTVQSPPRAPRSLAGPVVLIVVGVVFLLGTMGVLHWSNLWHLYAQYWPALIIMWGVIKLVEYQRAQREGTRSSGIGVGGVFLLLFLICTGVIASEIRKVDWQSIHDEIGIDDDLPGWWGQSFTYTDTMTEAFPAGSSLHVISDRGAIKIIPSDDKQFKVEISKKIHAENQQEADKYNLQTKPQITSSEKTVTVNANTQGAGEHGVSTDLAIYVPAAWALVISSKHGDINVSGRISDVEISAQRGEVTVEDIKGSANLNLQRSSAKIANVSGDLSIEGRANEVSASNIGGAVRLNGEFMESVRLAQIAKTVTFKSSRTDLEFTKLEGSLELDSGDLRADSMQGPVRLSTRNKDVRLEGLAGDLRVDDSNGGIEITFRKLGNVQISNKNGDIQVTLPPQAAFRIDARALNGEIHSDFAQLKVDNGDNQATATGAVGNAVATLKLNNEHGTIEIRKGSAQPAAPERPSHETPQPPSPPEPTEN